MSLPDDNKNLLQRLRAAVIDGRTHNPGYRQRQLAALHGGLRTQSTAVCAAIAADSQSSSREVEAEFLLSMAVVRDSYEALDFDKVLQEESLAAEGRDNVTRRICLGLVVIRPIRHTRLYSILAPVVAAIAAGNCILVEVREDTS